MNDSGERPAEVVWSATDKPLDPDAAMEIIQPGMAVIDSNDDDVGTVKRVYRPVTVDERDSMSHDAFILVGDRGLFGMAKDLYFPSTFVAQITREHIKLSFEKERIPDMVLDQPVSLPGDNL